jgi:uncharacterized protein (DUF885 family)
MRKIIILLLIPLCLFARIKKESTGIDTLFNNFFKEYLKLRPETATEIGLTEDYGIQIQNDKLNDVSDKGYDELYDLFSTYKNKLKKYDRNTLSETQRISYDKLEWYLNNKISGEKYRYHDYIIDPMFSFHNNLTSLLTNHHKIESYDDAKDYIGRLRGYKTKIEQYLEQLKIRKQKGIIPPIFIIERFVTSLRESINIPAEENILFTSFDHRIKNIPDLDSKQKKELREEALEEIRNTVYPAYRKIIEYSANLKDEADKRAGAWKLPDGKNYYKYCLKRHTTTNMTPEEIHELGKKEVELIQEKIKEQLKSMGYSTDGEYKDATGQFWNDIYNERRSEFFYPDNEEGKKKILDDYRKIINYAENKIPELFSLIPRTPVVVKSVPKFMEKTAGTYYVPLKVSDLTGGTFYVNLSGQKVKPGMESLTFHEAIPGHHFQFAIAIESPDFMLFHSLLHPTGYIEGWALYVEGLALEYNWYRDIYSIIGYYNSELFRAVRLVVDTGIHAMKWSREDAHRYMFKNLGWGSYKEIDRYITWPGQACAYKAGEIKILELREKAKKELEDKFDIKEFHKVVLENGSIPLFMLEEIINRYIEEKKKIR